MNFDENDSGGVGVAIARGERGILLPTEKGRKKKKKVGGRGVNARRAVLNVTVAHLGPRPG